MSVKGRRHVHKYYRADALGVRIWACAFPTCSHHMPPHYAALIEGKASICWKCGEVMVLDGSNMSMDKPICNDCRSMNELNRKLEELNKSA